MAAKIILRQKQNVLFPRHFFSFSHRDESNESFLCSISKFERGNQARLGFLFIKKIISKHGRFEDYMTQKIYCWIFKASGDFQMCLLWRENGEKHRWKEANKE